MWRKILVITILFFLLVLVQNSFFAHFKLFGAVPNLVFVLFFLLAFFKGKAVSYSVIFYAVVAGFFLDIFSFTYLGPSIILLAGLAFLLKKIQALLKNQQDQHPVIYFLPLFVIFLSLYKILLTIILGLLGPLHTKIALDWQFFAGIGYSFLFAVIAFYIYKFLSEKIINTRQLKLF